MQSGSIAALGGSRRMVSSATSDGGSKGSAVFDPRLRFVGSASENPGGSTTVCILLVMH